MNERPDLSIVSTGKSETEVATELKARLRTELEAICKTMNEARSHGMQLSFNIGIDGFGRQVITALEATKPL